MKITFKNSTNLFVISYGKTSNAKISDGNEKIIQTYTFSLEQWKAANNGEKISMESFFSLDGANCLDCPFSGNQRAINNGIAGPNGKPVKCYTHKIMQYSGFLSMLRSINLDNVTTLNEQLTAQIIDLCAGKYIRFGTYGEPSLLPIELVKQMSNVAKNWTGYTHQYQKAFASQYSSFFMASAHNELERESALELGFRSFVVKSPDQEVTAITCPASKEGGYVSTCSKCGLCSGILGKGNKSVKINIH